ncbi:MAG: hypothetical protein D6776_02075 [Planctomycetota bacterium]|nr:MAG: hypothetical protein D6776_02075 [Planctomycetota bacterium]
MIVSRVGRTGRYAFGRGPQEQRASRAASCCRLPSVFVLAVALVTLYGSPAFATVLNISLYGNTSPGVTADWTAPYPFEQTNYTVVANGYNDDTLWVWDEQQNYVLTQPLKLDWVADPAAPYVNVVTDQNDNVLYYEFVAGTIVSSQYVQFDPDGGKTVQATVEFDAPFLGIINRDEFLFDSDFLGRPGVNYSDFPLRGIEIVQNGDTVGVGSNPNELVLSWWADSPGDWTRVVTAYSPVAAVPEPGWAGVLALLAVCGVAVGRRR